LRVFFELLFGSSAAAEAAAAAMALNVVCFLANRRTRALKREVIKMSQEIDFRNRGVRPDRKGLKKIMWDAEIFTACYK
jgi:hypothetical protein